MYFVHPQIQLNIKNFKLILSNFLTSPKLKEIEKRLSLYFPQKQIIFTDMGRTAFKLIVEQLNLQNSQILMPAYICDIFYPVLKQYNLQPIFLDIDLHTFHIKESEIIQKITPQTKSILVCHTYGLPLNVERIKEIIKVKGLEFGHPIYIIEDCAHSFGANTGNSGDVAFFSLYKQFPSFRGGMVVCPKDWRVQLLKTSFNFRDFISFLNCFSLFAFIFKKFGQNIAPKILRKEKLFNNGLGKINRISLNFFFNFLEDFEQSLEKRKEVALFFQEELRKLGFEVQSSENNVFCYLSALVPKSLSEKRDEIVRNLRKYKVFCSRIWHTPIVLNKEAQKEYKIDISCFPNTIDSAKRIINFPLQNYYTQGDIQNMILLLQKVIKTL